MNAHVPFTQQPPSRGAMIDSCISKFQELGINLVAIDFDCTIVDIHTHGTWTKSVAELVEHVRSEFRLLLQACCEHDIQVAIVTFSGQTKLVQSVVETVVGFDYFASHVVVRGRDRSWTYQGNGMHQGKQHFIASAVEELEHKLQAQRRRRLLLAANGETSHGSDQDNASIRRIHKNTTVLIDDDTNNIKCALMDGTRAVWLNPKKPHHILKDLARLV
ncbi:hypothetical protein MPSEU_000165200 [Mayamaea pseudoterrestris]|nr:hypothetical protein MPSEU_000165200 [Mayamaea pseudoterrestris]